jgi:serine/threonine protein phosphatase PrpC
VAGRASIVGAAVTHVGKVRDHNEDAHFLDPDVGLFLVCDGMGGHAAGEVASALAVQTIRGKWLDGAVRRLAEAWLAQRTADAKKQLFGALRAGVIAAHDQILAEGARDDAKSGMGTTLVGALVIGSELVFAHAGDSRAYLVRDGISMQLTEDHTLLARLLAAGIDVDVSGEGARFRSMLTNALGIGQECKVATFVVPLADGDRFLLCSDGISEYVPEAEIGFVLTAEVVPAQAAERLVQLALERGGGDNATALVIAVKEAGESPQPAEHRRHDDDAIRRCPLWGAKVSPQQRLRALRIAIPRDHAAGERIPAHTLGDRVAWIVVEGALSYGGKEVGPGALLYPESLVSDAPAPDRDGLAIARSDVRALALRADDFRELCDDDAELGESLLETVGALISTGHRRPGRTTRVSERADTELERRPPSNSDVIEPPPPVMAPLPITVEPAAAPPSPPRSPPPPPPRPSTPLPTAQARPAPGAPPPPVPAADRALPPPPPVPAADRASPPPPPVPAADRASQPPPPPHAASRTVPPPPPPPPRERPPTPAPPLPPLPGLFSSPASFTRPPPLVGAPATARVAPSHASGPLPPRPSTPLPGLPPRPPGPALARPSAPVSEPKPPPLAAPTRSTPPGMAAILDPADLEDDDDPDTADTGYQPNGDGDPATSPRLRRAPSEPEIEALYVMEMDAEPPPLPPLPTPGGGDDDDDDPIAEMIVSVDDESGRVTQRTTDTHDATMIVQLSEAFEAEAAAAETDRARGRAITAEDGASVSGTISVPPVPIDAEPTTVSPPPTPPSMPPRRARRVTDGKE